MPAPEARRLSDRARRFPRSLRNGSLWSRLPISSKWMCWPHRPRSNCGWPEKFARSGVRLVAEKVETYEVFERTLAWGYSYFQGYFFSRPQMLTRHDIPANKLNYLRVLQAANRRANRSGRSRRADQGGGFPELSLAALSEFTGVCAGLRCAFHSARAGAAWRARHPQMDFAGGHRLHGRRQASGVDRAAADSRAVMRVARGCRQDERTSSDDLFLLGLLSSIDAILDMSMENVLKEIAIREEIRDALLGQRQPVPPSDGCRSAVRNRFVGRARGSRRAPEDRSDAIPDRFIEAVDWAGSTIRGQRIDGSAERTEAGESVVQDSKPEPL